MNTSAARRPWPALVVLVLCLLAAATQAAPAFAAGCGTRQTTKPFARFGDANNYFLAGNGGFEQGSAQWSLSGGASVVSGNETFYVRSTADTKSLRLPQGASASSGWVCVTKDDPSFRFFAKTTGSSNYSSLNVSATIKGQGGSVINHWFGSLTPQGFTSWAPSGIYSYAIWLNQPWLYGSGDTVQVKFDFNVQGTGGTWQIDDLYVDPFKGT